MIALLLSFSLLAPDDVQLSFRADESATSAQHFRLDEIVLGAADLKPGTPPSDDELLRALKREAAKSGADRVSAIRFSVDKAGQPMVSAVLERSQKRGHGVRAKNGIILFFAGEGFPPRGVRVRDIEVRADELRGPPSRAMLIGALTRKAKALDGDAIAMLNVDDGVARAVVVRKKRSKTAAPRESKRTLGRGVVVDKGWYDVPPTKNAPTLAPPPPPPMEPIGDAPPDPAGE